MVCFICTQKVIDIERCVAVNVGGDLYRILCGDCVHDTLKRFLNGQIGGL